MTKTQGCLLCSASKHAQRERCDTILTPPIDHTWLHAYVVDWLSSRGTRLISPQTTTRPWTMIAIECVAHCLCAVSPELCNGEPYNTKSDMWAVGCLTYEVCSQVRARAVQSSSYNKPTLFTCCHKHIFTSTLVTCSDRLAKQTDLVSVCCTRCAFMP
jgi:hypothetical protein